MITTPDSTADFRTWLMIRCLRCGTEGEAPEGNWLAWAADHRCSARPE